MFHGDLILSKAFGEECIVLWLIKGFNSKSPPPLPISAPTTHDKKFGTRSAFSPPPTEPNGAKQYMRLLEFASPDSIPFYMRFSLYSPLSNPVNQPILAICTGKGKIYFWDLKRLVDFQNYIESTKDSESNGTSTATAHPQWLGPLPRANKVRDLGSHDPSLLSQFESTETPASRIGQVTATQKKKYAIGDPFVPVEAHKVESLGLRYNVTGRHVAWSVCGKWCVVVGDANRNGPSVVGVLQRWGDENKKGKGKGKARR
jgi:polycomb protein EED